MSKYIVLYNFSKYYNRKIKRLATFADYEALITPGENTPAQYKGFKREFRNFDFSDGVYAKHVINVAKNELQIFKVDQPDYFVLEESFIEGEGEEATTTTKVSRWYVLEAIRIRGNQYELSLRRDLLADYYNEVLDAPVFIQRGSPQQSNDPAIFNKEGFTFNQIKKYECLLNYSELSGKKKGWVVGYINREDTSADIGPCSCKQEINLNVPNYEDLPDNLKSIIENGTDITVDNENEVRVAFPYKVLTDPSATSADSSYRVKDIRFTVSSATEMINLEVTETTSPKNAAMPLFMYQENSQGIAVLWSPGEVVNEVRTNLNYWGSVAAAFQDIVDADTSRTYVSQTLIDRYKDTYYYKDGKYYKIIFTRRASDYYLLKQYTGAQLRSNYDSLSFECLRMIQSLYTIPEERPKEIKANPSLDQSLLSISLDRYFPVYEISVEESDATEFELTIPKERNQLLDSPYDMFVMPLGAIEVSRPNPDYNSEDQESEATITFTTLLNTSLAAARGIAAKGTSSKILDIQILPYCPFPEILDINGNIDLSTAEEDKDYTIIKKVLGGDHVDIGIILYPLHSIGSLEISLKSMAFHHELSDELLDYVSSAGVDIMKKKIYSETSFARFVSPNFAAIYDMNPQKNGTKGAKNIKIDYYYKPYTPYIHVKPILDSEYSLYGIETNDPEGLICSGDFSIATASSKWEEYQVQNKNFQNQFDRQIQNLDVNNSIALEQQKITGGIGIATGALSGAAAGAVAGAVAGTAGGPIGALVGGAVGAIGGLVTSWVGYSKDMEHLKKSQNEARGYATDMYTYQLGNVQALPNTLNKVSAFTPNNKIFPFIEVYTCTDEEKEALRNKIKYNGMTIMRIGHIRDFINPNVSYYVQGQLIRLEGIDEDSHVIAEIANEIKEGAYYYGSDTSES